MKDDELTHRIQSLLCGSSDLHVATQRELAHVADEEIVGRRPLAVERIKSKSRGVVQTGSSNPDESA